MRLKDSKKSAVWYYLVLFGYIFGLASFFYYDSFATSPRYSNLYVKGMNQNTQLDLNMNEMRYYLKYSSKLTFVDSIYTLAEKGGYYANPKCGVYFDDLPVYQSDDKDILYCAPDTKSELKKSFPPGFAPYLKKYGGNLSINNYDFSFVVDKKTTLIANAKKKIALFLREKGEPHAWYMELYSQMPFIGPRLEDTDWAITVYKYFRPTFSAEFDYTFADYQYIKESIEALSDACSPYAGAELKTCITAKAKELSTAGYTWKVTNDEKRKFGFELTTEKKYFPRKDPIVYRFAAYMKDHPPAPIEDIKAEPRQGADKSILLSFKPAPESDVTQYNIYYSPDFDLKDKPIEKGAIKQGETSASKITFQKSAIGQSSETFTACAFQTLGSSCKPEMLAAKLYLSDNKLFCLVPNLEKEQYYITITAVDKAGNEINQVVNTAEITPEDLLAPGKSSYSFSYDPDLKKIIATPITPSINIDSTTFSNDLNKYYIFIQKGTSQGIVSLDNLERTSVPTAASGDVYYIAIIAQDTSDNPIEIKQISALEQVLEIKPEYQQVITELSNPQPIVIP
jgi:hypothetical protein